MKGKERGERQKAQKIKEEKLVMQLFFAKTLRGDIFINLDI
jgi:hypothetical protein